MPYVPPELNTDGTAQAAGILQALEDLVPGWEPQEGSIETQIAEALGITAATMAQFLIDETAEAYAGFAERVLGIARVPAAAPGGPSTWTVRDDAGYLIPAGSFATFASPLTGQPVAFETIDDTNVTVGETSVADVELLALEPGPDGNGAIGPADEFEPLPFVTGVELTALAAGGEDEETDDAFLDRVTDRTRRLQAIPVTASDYAAFALDVPGVDRAAALNLLDPGPHPTPIGTDPYVLLDELGHVTVFAIDIEGNLVDATTRAAILAYLSGEDRPIGVTPHVASATLTNLAVVATIRIDPGADPDSTVSSAAGAVQTYFDRAQWRRVTSEPGLWAIPRTVLDRPVRAFDVAHAIETVAGVSSTVTCTVNGAAAVTLAGWAPLPNLTSASVSIA